MCFITCKILQNHKIKVIKHFINTPVFDYLTNLINFK